MLTVSNIIYLKLNALYNDGMSYDPKDKLIQNEQIIREKNSAVGRGIKKYFRNSKEVKEAPIAFICECSNLDCDQHINTSIDSYEKLHKRKDRFTIYRGHETPSVERIVAQEDDFDIVQKYAL